MSTVDAIMTPRVDRAYPPGPIAAKGAFTGEFVLGDGLSLDEAPLVIERDRINEGQWPGFGRKLLPLRLDPETGVRTAGGYYLVDTFADGSAFLDRYVNDRFILDGVPILRRGYFFEPTCHCWHVLGAQDFKPLETAQHVVRFERWSASLPTVDDKLEKLWPEIRDQAEARGLSAVWLLFNGEQTESIGLVTVAERKRRGNPEKLDDDLLGRSKPRRRWATSSNAQPRRKRPSTERAGSSRFGFPIRAAVAPNRRYGQTRRRCPTLVQRQRHNHQEEPP